jgi:hemolysin III
VSRARARWPERRLRADARSASSEAGGRALAASAQAITKPWSVRDDYSRAERASDAVVHALGVAAALVAAPALLGLVVIHRGDAGAVVAAAVYGTTLVAMLTCSALYNTAYGSAWTGVFKRLDHTAIFFKIAGTYTPFVVLSGARAGFYLLAGVWGAAAVGAVMKILAPHRFRLLTVALCLGMGWVGAVFGAEVFNRLAPQAFTLIAVGGILYSVGVIFYLWPGLPHHTTIWHVFVLAATGVFYAAVVVQVLHPQTAGEIPATPGVSLPSAGTAATG